MKNYETHEQFYQKLQNKGPQILIFGLILISVYKVWKITTFNVFVQPLEENLQYATFESIKTIYRILATILGVFIIKKYFRNFKVEFIKDNFKITIVNILIILPLYFLTRVWLFDFSFFPVHFCLELFFNFFTGSYEEIAFRGLILVGLAQYFKPMHSILLSSLLFSLWHYDVIDQPISYILIFWWGVYAGLSYLRGNSLMSLILFHFLWDQIFFGFSWTASTESSEDIVAYAELVMLTPFIWLLWRDKLRLNKFDKIEKLVDN